MNLTKNTRRAAAAALTVPILLFTAACGSDDDKGSSGEGVVKVEGKAGEKPKITVPKGAKPSDTAVTKTLIKGDGATVKKGDLVRLDFAAQTMKGQNLGGSWTPQPGTKPGAPRTQVVSEVTDQMTQQMLPPKVMSAVAGQKVGSRFEVEGTAKALIGEGLNPQSGIKPEDGLVWVVDVVGAKKVDKKAKAEGTQAAPESGMPEVKAVDEKAAQITVPKGEKAPKGLEEQILIKGKGPEVKAGEGLIAQYTGVKWEDGKKFDSSWDHGGATAFQIGTGQVVQGWDKALVGKHVGDRVEIVIPPKLAYGPNPQHELAKNTLVFSVDIVGTV
ncbi:FKBP-type peptidyl-prolyl cis-trans isomerase [Streptomyces inhibens]|uniref:FKBP-type peptidyl-prolyl cis-trans isomerase n=1 Tax=Streptomyces inhibens TaxID=2293571 RepID=UPI001EE713CC|nr:FKBP-type peptidyl-prolyl cis-trans isomerase [Streptomyces inhibens]UKY49145.1 FKBP-type peptidyl-prolyl cis-trans isomerase [Streptomyces inhibens]